MPPTYTPLRYPGGKAKFGPYLSDVLRTNKLVGANYAEVFAGGAGAGLHLLFRGYASRLQLNDIDRGVVSFWRAVLTHSEQFAKRIERVALSVREWDRQKEVLRSSFMGFDLGFAFFYLNRTNRSGIMNGGIIGGRDQQGKWGMNARFNRSELADRVRAVGRMRRHISISRLDALDFLNQVACEPRPRQLVYLDPPYYSKGHELYTNFYSPDDHGRIASYLRNFDQPWVATYDDCPEIRKLYASHTLLSSELSYSARQVRRGKEVVIFAPGLVPPQVETEARKRSRGFAVVRRHIAA
jgi:DNA adenine methylase